MSFILRIKITYDPLPLPYERRIREASRVAHRAGMLFWFHDMLPGHFGAGAAERYGYAPRTAGHERRKSKRGKKGQALVFTGFGREKTLMEPYIQAFPTRATMHLYAPSYFKMRAPAGKPDMAAEVFTILPEEKTRIEAVMKKAAEEELQRRGIKRTVVIG